IPKRRRPRPQSSPPATMAADPPTAGRLSCKHGWMDPGRYPSSLGGASCRSRPALWSRPSPPPPRRRRGSRLHQARAPPHPTDRKGVLLLMVVVKGGNNREDWRCTGHAMAMKRTPWTTKRTPC
uniref:Uncharacterized protein n=1 Tax=Aegilops tauschii subsp. strangulata TaxID=200361 RepID=A0A453GNS5_AEGTS